MKILQKAHWLSMCFFVVFLDSRTGA